MQDLARFLYYGHIVPEILGEIIVREGLGKYQYGVAFNRYFSAYLRKSLFIGLSDGAKIDFFRRHHIDLSQEQVIPYYRSSNVEYLQRLRDDLGDPQAQFWAVFLIDDFMASGYTLIRHQQNTAQSTFTGSLCRVYEHHEDVINSARTVYVCHYIATEAALERAHVWGNRAPGYQGKLKCLTALPLSRQLSIGEHSIDGADELNRAVARLCEKYYHPSFEDSNSLKGGGVRYGFGGIGLPLVMYSNTPNNALFLLWLDRDLGTDQPEFRALFRRINRHRQR
jgi:hypothetical protein